MEDLETALSDVDGERGQLVVRGRRLDELVGQTPFEGMVELLWQRPQKLGLARLEAWRQLSPAWDTVLDLLPMDGLRVGLSLLQPTADPDLLTGAMGVLVAAMARRTRGLPPVAPDSALSHAEDTMRMVLGQRVGAPLIQALDGYLVTVAEHGMNASTFAARVVASTRAGVRPAVLAALCALEGPLHGGAPGPVLDMLDAIGTADTAVPWLEAEIAAGRRIMGFGHRIYRVRDPRADALKGLVRALSSDRLTLAERVEHDARQVLQRHHPERRLDTNVEFYTALLLEALGLPRTLFTPVFACGRIAGWCAHVAEQEGSGRLIRPGSKYVGAVPTAV